MQVSGSSFRVPRGRPNMDPRFLVVPVLVLSRSSMALSATRTRKAVRATERSSSVHCGGYGQYALGRYIDVQSLDSKWKGVTYSDIQSIFCIDVYKVLVRLRDEPAQNVIFLSTAC